ncbi:MAG: glycerol-3-phosphate dehydrogenase/oxidase [Acidobacteria bacterium]|nr:glycerol-3-phosphate dehydrogenase/oxidase [Acidobacteriota bacterium]
MNRTTMLASAGEKDKIWDFLVIGGGATGLGCALDAASRGFSVLLLEQNDFGKGTSSRSTKLVHGGVRYLAQGNLSLVKEALKERGLLLKNAPHIVSKQAFVVPVYSYWDKFFYGAGLKTYNLLSGKYGFGKSEILSRKETLKRLPNVRKKDLEGGILYFDGQFDDTRLLVDIASTAAVNGAVLLNHARVFSLHRGEADKIDGAAFSDELTGQVFLARARSVINATGAFSDSVRRMSDRSAEDLIAPSQGIHLVFDQKFLPGSTALMVPKTSDGRVLFAIPWHGRAIFGTTDTPVTGAELEPRAFEAEIDFIIDSAAKYLADPPKRSDILSVFTGIRPLVKTSNSTNTAALSRDHTIEIDLSGLVTITGGKWTTYRRMAEDAVNQASEHAGLERRKCVTDDLAIQDTSITANELAASDPSLAEILHERLPYRVADVVVAVRFEMAHTLEDVLARRTRALFLDASAALGIAQRVAVLIAAETDKDEAWIDDQVKQFESIASGYLPPRD